MALALPLVFTSCEENNEEFQKWADEKMKEGYIVTSLYDKKTGTYYGYLSVPPADVVG